MFKRLGKQLMDLATFSQKHPEVFIHHIRTIIIVCLCLIIIERSFKVYALEATIERNRLRHLAHKETQTKLLEIIYSQKMPSYLDPLDKVEEE